MAVLPLGAKNSKKVTTNPSHVQCQKKKTTAQRDDEKPPAPPQPWGRALKSFFTCKHHQTVAVEVEKVKRPTTRTGWSGVLCSLRESSSKVMQRPEPTSPAADSLKNNGGSSSSSISDMSGALTTSSSSSLSHSSASITAATSSSSSSSLGNGSGGSFRGMHLRRFSGCYDCHCHHSVVDPMTTGVLSRVPSSSSSSSSSSSRRSSVFSCSVCGEVFTKCEALELHQALKHAVIYGDERRGSRRCWGAVGRRQGEGDAGLPSDCGEGGQEPGGRIGGV